MIPLVAAALFFVGIHLLISGTSLRARLVMRMGERNYLGVFSLMSAAGLAWLILSFIHVRVVLPTTLLEWRWAAVLLNFVALLFICFGVLGKSPTAVGGESKLDEADPATGMHRITRHPMLWGFLIWAAVHMAFNPQSAPLVFFGAFLLLALLGPRAIDAKRAAQHGEKWQRYLAVTSNLPFAAILQGRNRLALSELLAFPLFAAAVLTELLVLGHTWLFGVPAL